MMALKLGNLVKRRHFDMTVDDISPRYKQVGIVIGLTSANEVLGYSCGVQVLTSDFGRALSWDIDEMWELIA